MTKEDEYQRRKAFGKLSRRQELSERSKYNMFTFKKKDFTFKGFHVIEEPSYSWSPTSDELKLLANIDWAYLSFHCSKLVFIMLLSIFIFNKYEL